MRTRLVLLLVSCLGIQPILAQQRMPRILSSTQKRKVLHARKLFNQFKIYQGERILKDLIKQDPYNYYYHEALVRLQRQVLDQLVPFSKEDKEESTDTTSADNNRGDTVYAHRTKTSNEPIAATPQTEEEEWNGLDPSIDRKEEKKSRRGAEWEESITEAQVEIDSSLLKDDFMADQDGTPQTLPGLKQDKALKRQMKAARELAMIPYSSYYSDFLYNCRRATLMVEHADSASAYLYDELVDTITKEKSVPEKALDYYQQGIDDFSNRDWTHAIQQFQYAILEHPDYYSACLRLGDAAFLAGIDSLALSAYMKARALQPKKSDPHERLSRVWYKKGQFEEAATHAVRALMIYPKHHLFSWLERIAQKQGITWQSQWICRESFPLSSQTNWHSMPIPDGSPWKFYQQAGDMAVEWFDSVGMAKPGAPVKTPYLEVFAWEHMLDSTGKDTFAFARAMRKAGLLPAHVLLTQFHHDLYPQFLHLVQNKPQDVRDYIYLLLNWELPMFDPLKKWAGLPIPVRNADSNKKLPKPFEQTNPRSP